MEIGKTFCGRTDGHLSSNLLGHRRGDDLKIVKLQYILHMSHNMVNFGPLEAEIGLPDWGTPANFNGFRLLASLLHRRRSPEANQTLHDVWPSPGLVHCIYIFSGLLSPKGIL